MRSSLRLFSVSFSYGSGSYLDILLARKLRSPAFIPRSSPWPFLTAHTLTFVVLNFVTWMHYFINSIFGLFLSIVVFCLTISFWFKDTIFEGQYMGVYTQLNQRCIRDGFKLFLVSEAMFFFALFWSYFHYSLCPSVWIGNMWPPYGMKSIVWWQLPMLNTLILVSSGFTLTYAQKAIASKMDGSRYFAILGFHRTLGYAAAFLFVQWYEFTHAPFSINDSVYGSIFFLITGFHGLHVIVGTIFILVCYLRLVAHHFYVEEQLALDCAAWYWHFVDAVWILVFFIVYIWGGH